MAKDARQRLKLLHLKNCFDRRCDDEHPLTIEEIRAYLERCGIEIRKNETITEGIEDLQSYGMKITHEFRSPNYYYSDKSRLFRRYEIQLLIDSVQSSKFLTVEQTQELIEKICSLCSEKQEDQLKRSVGILYRIKTEGENVHINLDTIRNAIYQDRQISFYTGHYTANKEFVLRDYKTVVSPLSLIYTDDNYYLLGNWHSPDGSQPDGLRHYRVDRMRNISILLSAMRKGTEGFGMKENSIYTQLAFNMFHGETKEVTLKCRSSIMDTVLDRFGYDSFILPLDKDHFQITPKVMISPQFFGWVFGLNGLVVITGPEDVQAQMQEMLNLCQSDYRK